MIDPAETIVAAYYYPGWHHCARRTIRRGDTEWALLYDDVARAAYPDVRRPFAGPVDPTAESIAAEARQALDGGIDAFLWCWYWDRGDLLLNRELELYLQADLPAGFRYALMWVNKRPHFSLPIAEMPPAWFDQRLVRTDEADFRAMIEHLIAHHWRRDDYIRLDDRPLLPVFAVEPLIRQHGPGGLRRLLRIGDDLARSAGFAGVHYVAIMHRLHARWRWWMGRFGLGRWAGVAPLGRIGFRAVSNYLNLVDWNRPATQRYRELIERRVPEWRGYAAAHDIPFWPSISPGWDARVRGVPRDPPPAAHPWAPLITDEKPADFAWLVAQWESYARCTGNVAVLPVASWNEWTEGHAVAPCDRHGDAMLNVLRARRSSAGAAARGRVTSVAAGDTR